MSTPLIVALPGNEAMAQSLARELGADASMLDVHRFPDEECLVRFTCDVARRHVVLVASLDRPDGKFLPLVFAAATAKDLGARHVGLVAPYLSYMRQDKRFHPGEAVTARVFADQLSRSFDWLVTIDPHLHRVKHLNDIYAIPAEALHVAPQISKWIAHEIPNALLIGPDDESRQWVSDIAEAIGAPFMVLEKTRRGDRDVENALPDVSKWRDRTPVLVDDIVSTARTMIETAGHIREAGLSPPVCVGIHAVFAGDAYQALKKAGAARIVTTNTIAHESNAIDVSSALGAAIARHLIGPAGGNQPAKRF